MLPIANIDNLSENLAEFQQMAVSLTQRLQTLTDALINWRITEIEIPVDAKETGWNPIDVSQYISQHTIDGERLLEGLTSERKAHDKLIDLVLNVPVVADDENRSSVGLRPTVTLYLAKNNKSGHLYAAKPVRVYRRNNQTITVAYEVEKITIVA